MPADFAQLHERLRERLSRVVSGAIAGVQAEPLRTLVDVIVTHAEVNEKHGTGVLLKRLFRDVPDVATVRSRDLYGGEQEFGVAALVVAHRHLERRATFGPVLDAFEELEVRRILCVPFYPDDVRTALVLQAVYAAPLCTFVMDDQNIHAREIPDALLAELFARSRLRLAISPEMRDAYQQKFGVPIWFQPPTVEREHLRTKPGAPSSGALRDAPGVLIGNIWGAEWILRLAQVTRESGLRLKWYSQSGLRWSPLSAAQLGAAGIEVLEGPSDTDLVKILRSSPYVVVSSGTLEGSDDRRFIAQLSLPSKIPFVLATSNTPIVVLGHPDTAAARFVNRTGTGVSSPYEATPLRAAVARVTEPTAQAQMRAAAARLAPAFSSEGVREWIWDSLAAGKPVDDRWERLAVELRPPAPSAP